MNFTCDYTEGAHPQILQRLLETNMAQEPGYGEDSFCASAREKIRQACGSPFADVFFLVGGTQTNATVIDAVLRPGVYQIQVPQSFPFLIQAYFCYYYSQRK